MPGPPSGGAYSDPGVLEAIARNAGLEPENTGDVTCAFEYPAEDALVQIAGFAGMIVLAARTSGEQTVRDAIVGAMEPFRNADGSYHVEDECHYLIARAQ